MEILKKIFPFSFGVQDKNQLIVRTVVYVAAILIASVILSILGWIVGLTHILAVLLGSILSIVGWIIETYCIGGGVIMYLAYFKVIK